MYQTVILLMWFYHHFDLANISVVSVVSRHPSSPLTHPSLSLLSYVHVLLSSIPKSKVTSIFDHLYLYIKRKVCDLVISGRPKESFGTVSAETLGHNFGIKTFGFEEVFRCFVRNSKFWQKQPLSAEITSFGRY